MSTFESLGLHPFILRAIEELGFETPTQVQGKAIPAILESEQDLIALAQTGTGKTASFGLPVIHMMEMDVRHPQALILCPTRELAIQITKDLASYAKYVKGFRMEAVYGGTPISGQIRSLKRGVHVVVATPGRALDLINRRVLDLSQIKWVVLDEADEMLNMGFQKDLDAILSETPADKQTLLFSATMAPAVSRIARKYMDNPREIAIGTRNSGAKKVAHEFYMVHARDRYEAVKRILGMIHGFYGIIFCRTRQDTLTVARKLNQDGYKAGVLNGDFSQAQRDAEMRRFREKEVQILVATDVAARGLDVDDLTHVINFELPDDLEVYIHRSGRTGRAGKSGISVSIIHTREMGKIKALERMAGKDFTRKSVPTGKEICEHFLMQLVTNVATADVDEARIAPFMPAIYERFEGMDREELIKHFISAEFGRISESFQHAPDINVRREPRQRTFDRGGRQGQEAFAGFSINLGRIDNLTPPRLMGFINQQLRRKRVRIGRIRIDQRSSHFEVESRYAQDFETFFKGAIFDGVEVKVKTAKKIGGGDYRDRRRGGRNFDQKRRRR